MRILLPILFVLALLLTPGCEVSRRRAALGPSPAETGEVRSPRDLDLGLEFRLVRPGEPFFGADFKELYGEKGIKSVQKTTPKGHEIYVLLGTLATNEDSLVVASTRWGNTRSLNMVCKGNQWYRIHPDGTLKAAKWQGGAHTYRFAAGEPNDDSERCTVKIRTGTDGRTGQDDTFVSVSWSGDSLETSFRELSYLRAQELAKRARTRGHYQALMDSEGFVYLCSVHGGLPGIALWDPFLFQPDRWSRLTADPDFDSRWVRPLATIALGSLREGGQSSTVDFAELRRKVYGVAGKPDVLRLVKRESGFMVEGGDNWLNRKEALELLGKKEPTLDDYERAIRLEPRLAKAYHDRAKRLAKSPWSWHEYTLRKLPRRTLETIASDLTRAMDLEPITYANAATYHSRAITWKVLKELAKAEKDIARAVALAPKNTTYLELRAAVRKELGRESEEDQRLVKRAKEEQKRKEKEDSERERRESPARILVDAGVAVWRYPTGTLTNHAPAYAKKFRLFERRLKDIREKPLLIQLVGKHAEYRDHGLKRLGFKIVKGKDVDTKERIQLVIESNHRTSAVLKTAQGRVVRNIRGKDVMARAYNHVLVIHLKGQLDWHSETYSKLVEHWDRVHEKLGEKDYDAALEGLDGLAQLDRSDPGVAAQRRKILAIRKDWKSIVEECTRQIQTTGKKDEQRKLYQERLQAHERLEDVDGIVKDLLWLEKHESKPQSYIQKRAGTLARAGRYREAAEAWSKYLRTQDRASARDLRTHAAYLEKAGDEAAAASARAKAIDRTREESSGRFLVEEGIATWKEGTAETEIKPEFRGRHRVVSMRFRDPDEPRIRVYFDGGQELAGKLGASGLQVDQGRPDGCVVRITAREAPGAWGVWVARFQAPDGSALGSMRARSWRFERDVLVALRALATKKRISVLSPAYEEMIPVVDQWLSICASNHEAREIRHLKEMLLRFPAHYELKLAAIDRFVSFGEYAEAEKVAREIASFEASKRQAYRDRLKGVSGLARDPVRKGLECLARIHQWQDRWSDALADYDRLIEKVPERKAHYMDLKVAGLERRCAFKEASELKRAVIEEKRKPDGDLTGDYFQLGDLLKKSGDAFGAEEAYRRAGSRRHGKASFCASRARKRSERGDHAGAVADMTRAIELSGKKVPESYYRLRGIDRERQGDVDGALQDFASALAIRETEGAYLARAALHEKLGDAAAAEADRRKAYGVQLEHGHEYRHRAHRRREAGDFEGALIDAQRALKEARNDRERAEALTELAEARMAMNGWKEALEDLTRAIRLEPTPARLSRRVELHRRQGENGRAEADARYLRSLARKPREFPIVASTLMSLGEPTMAIGLLDRAIPFFGPAGQANLYRSRGDYKLRSGDLDGAERDYGKAFDLTRRPADLFRRAWVRKRQGDAEGAEADRKTALEFPADPSGRLSRAGSRALLGDVDGALEDCRVYRASAPRNPIGYSAAARICLQAGRVDEALKLAVEAIALGADDFATGSAHHVRGMALASRGRVKEAREAAAKTVSGRWKGQAWAWANRAEILLGINDLDGARSAVERSMALGRGDTRACRILAEIALATGNKDAAREAVGKALSLFPFPGVEMEKLERLQEKLKGP